MRGKKGFTLIEVLIVVIILGILATIAIPQFGNIVERARASEAVTNIAAIRTALEVFQLERGGDYPDYADVAAINAGLDCEITANNFTYVVAGGAGTFTITATKVSAPQAGATITYTRGAAPWGGTHTGAPRN
jgi:prepilin-type N-terminal cleavage/methylation domain-containing protein